MKTPILIIEDDIATAETIRAYLSKSDDYDFTLCHSGADGLNAFGAGEYDVVLLDLNLPDQYGLDVLKTIRKQNTDCAVIVITGTASMAVAVDAMKMGAHDFIAKPIAPERLNITVKNAVEKAKLTTIAQTYEKISRKGFQSFVGQSPKMQAVYNILENAANSRVPVFITGQSGTGKELAARAIHDLGPRSEKPFEVLNCASIPHDLLESEIFGHVRGAFTGATSDRVGAAARADKGTLFLDELGEMPMELQAKLLRFIQTGEFTPVGGKPQSADLRFISATNREPLKAVEEGFLREDLYYRLNVIPVHMPRLQERGRDDILMLADYFLKQSAREEGKNFQAMSPEVEDFFTSYQWPGNVRELQNTIRRIIVLNKGNIIEAHMLNVVEKTAQGASGKDFSDDSHDTTSHFPQNPDAIKPLKYYEREIIKAALRACGNNITEASKRLGINPATIHRKQKQWDKD